jgi:hypothetical protein
VPRCICGRPPFAFSTSGRLRAQGRDGQDCSAPTAQGRRLRRALFVIDSQGTIQWSYLSHRGEPGADGILRLSSRCRRHPCRVIRSWHRQSRASHLVLPMGEARSHPGSGGGTASAGGVRRLRVPVLRPGHPSSSPPASRPSAAFAFRHFPLAEMHPHAVSG